MKSPKIPSTDPAEIAKHVRENWIRTFMGVLLLAALAGGAMTWLGINLGITSLILGLFTIVLPTFSWYNSATMVKRLMRCQPPMPGNRDHQRLVRLVNELYPATGLKVKPEVLVSPVPIPNAFATGRNADNAFIAATEGLFMVDLSDEELKAILAHELAHVKNHDVAITSLTSVLGSLFAIVIATGFPSFFNQNFVRSDRDLLGKLSDKTKSDKKNFATPAVGLVGFFISMAIFAVVSFFAKFITLFITRARESGADALAAQWTGNPCALATALRKITDWMNRNQLLLQMRIMMDGTKPMLFLSFNENEDKPTTLGGKFSKWMRELGEAHPPVPARIEVLEAMAGSTCPTMDDIRKERNERLRRLINAGRRASEEAWGSDPRQAPSRPRAQPLTPPAPAADEKSEAKPEDKPEDK